MIFSNSILNAALNIHRLQSHLQDLRKRHSRLSTSRQRFLTKAQRSKPITLKIKFLTLCLLSLTLYSHRQNSLMRTDTPNIKKPNVLKHKYWKESKIVNNRKGNPRTRHLYKVPWAFFRHHHYPSEGHYCLTAQNWKPTSSDWQQNTCNPSHPYYKRGRRNSLLPLITKLPAFIVFLQGKVIRFCVTWSTLSKDQVANKKAFFSISKIRSPSADFWQRSSSRIKRIRFSNNLHNG